MCLGVDQFAGRIKRRFPTYCSSKPWDPRPHCRSLAAVSPTPEIFSMPGMFRVSPGAKHALKAGCLLDFSKGQDFGPS